MSEVEKKTGSFESFDGTPIYYEVRGNGPPVVMAYGIACLMNHWRHQVKYFSSSHQTILFDYRGHHNTPMPKNRRNLSIDAIAQDIKELLAHLNITQASFWSHSFGSQILIHTYKKYPELFSNMVFINGFATNPINKMFGNDLATNGFVLFKNIYRKLPSQLSSFWRTIVNNPLTLQLSALAGGFNIQLTSFKDIEVYGRGVGAMDLDAFIPLFDQMMKYDGRSVLSNISTPTLIVGGTKDAVTPPRYQKELHKKICESELLIVPYGSHCTQLDMPDFVNLRIEKFLKKNSYD